MRKILNRVTITGADDSTRLDNLFTLSNKYPWVEWGILLSASSQSRPRFPSLPWTTELEARMRASVFKEKISTSGHLCGKWVRHICKGDWSSFTKEMPVWMMFKRLQLNFHSYLHKIKDKQAFIQGFKGLEEEHPYPKQFIFQLDNVNNEIVDVAIKGGVDACPFFDLSGGVGTLPDHWEKARENIYTGYAGGLSPENVTSQLEEIEKVCGEGPIWIDVETHVRTPDNRALDMEKVEAFLEAAKPWVIT